MALKILMVASEGTPFIKTGGLADVVGSLPGALAARGADVRVVLPRYAAIDAGRFPVRTLAQIPLAFDGDWVSAEIQAVSDTAGTGADRATVRATVDDAADDSTSTALPVALSNATGRVATYLIEAPRYFRRPQCYSYDDDLLRFGFFCRAALEVPRVLEWKPDIIHCHDWHAGLLPAYLQTLGATEPSLRGVKTVFTIHNLAYQGIAPKEFLPRLGLDWSLFTARGLEFYDQINALKSGLVFSDALTAVSPQYAREIQTSAYGEGLEGMLQERVAQSRVAQSRVAQSRVAQSRVAQSPDVLHGDVLRGIVNGINYADWNPRHDPHLAAPYGPDDVSGKAICKRDLLRRVGLADDSSGLADDGSGLPGRVGLPHGSGDSPDLPVIGMVSRLSWQKGLDLVAQALQPMLELGCHFVLLGTGDERYLRIFRGLGRKFPRATAMIVGEFNDDLAHHIYAGSDFFLMPSRYEPCGLGQMIALAYGTVPIVRATGGLADTVHEFDARNGNGNGFVFHDFSAPALLEAVKRGFGCYHTSAWPQLAQNALRCDFSWDASAARYMELFHEVAGAGLEDGSKEEVIL